MICTYIQIYYIWFLQLRFPHVVSSVLLELRSFVKVPRSLETIKLNKIQLERWKKLQMHEVCWYIYVISVSHMRLEPICEWCQRRKTKQMFFLGKAHPKASSKSQAEIPEWSTIGMHVSPLKDQKLSMLQFWLGTYATWLINQSNLGW